MWIDVDYWAVFDKNDDDLELFRGSMTACRRWAKKHGGTVAHVFMENIEA